MKIRKVLRKGVKPEIINKPRKLLIINSIQKCYNEKHNHLVLDIR